MSRSYRRDAVLGMRLLLLTPFRGGRGANLRDHHLSTQRLAFLMKPAWEIRRSRFACRSCFGTALSDGAHLANKELSYLRPPAKSDAFWTVIFLCRTCWIKTTLLPFVPRYVCGTSRGSIRGSNKGPISISLGFLTFPKVLICFGK
jgi:hypothetical protein